jgi:hypothetical protein
VARRTRVRVRLQLGVLPDTLKIIEAWAQLGHPGTVSNPSMYFAVHYPGIATLSRHGLDRQ